MSLVTGTFVGFNRNVAKAKKDGGVYKTNVLIFSTRFGAKEKTIADFALGKSPLLAKALDSLVEGDEIEIELDESQYKNLVMVKKLSGATDSAAITDTKTSAAPVAATKTATKRDDYGVGMAVGNALNNAALLLAHGIVKGELEEVARDILTLSIKLREDYMAGEFDKPAVTKTKTVTKKSAPSLKEAIVEVDELEF